MKLFIALVLSLTISAPVSIPSTPIDPSTLSVKSVSPDFSSAEVVHLDGSLHLWEVEEAYDNIIILNVNGELHEFAFDK